MNLHRLKPLTLAIVSLFATGPLLAADVADEPAKELAGMTVRQVRPTVAVQLDGFAHDLHAYLTTGVRVGGNVNLVDIGAARASRQA